MKPDPGTEIRFPVPGSFYTVEPITEGTEMSYASVHAAVKRERGSASAYPCQNCGETALDWAYTNDAGDLEKIDEASGRPYSDNTEFYIPLCRSCHKLLDNPLNPKYQGWLESLAVRMGRDRLSRAGKARAEAQWDRYRNDPEYRERRDKASAVNSIKAREALATAHENDPGLRKRQTEAMRNSKSMCLECGKVSRPGSIGMHQKHSGHEGVEKV